jgi:predicted sulfurtransferase
VYVGVGVSLQYHVPTGTGGIRCEKATSACLQLLKDTAAATTATTTSDTDGTSNSSSSSSTPPPTLPTVYHLEGGILNYLDTIPPMESKFNGECYVFDQRIAVTYGLQPSSRFTSMCFACRHPLSVEEDLQPETGFVQGLSCRYCAPSLTDQQKERFANRQRQIELGNHEVLVQNYIVGQQQQQKARTG